MTSRSQGDSLVAVPSYPFPVGRRRPPSAAEQARRKAWGMEQGAAVKHRWLELKARH